MEFLANERRLLDKYCPGLDAALANHDLATLEGPDSPAIELFRDTPGPGLLVPEDYSGLGADAATAARIQRAVGARSPSLAVATTMHHFSMASVIGLGDEGAGFEWLLMEAVAHDHRLLASGFAEGTPGQSILSPSLSARRVDGGLVVSGTKKPCSLARSMDLLTAGVVVTEADGSPTLHVILVPSDAEGLRVEPFWNSFALAGAESDAVVLDDVFVHEDLVMPMTVGFGRELDRITSDSFFWFELFVTASYLGAASALTERVLASERVSDDEKARVLGEIEGAALVLDGMALSEERGEDGRRNLGRTLIGRYAVQDAVNRAASHSIELLGGTAYVRNSDVPYLLAATHAMALHPPNRQSMGSAFARYARGEEIHIS